MSIVTQITAGGETRDIADSRIGDLSSLQTSEKESIVSAINECIFNPFADAVQCVVSRDGGIAETDNLTAVFYPKTKLLKFSGRGVVKDAVYSGMEFSVCKCRVPGYTLKASFITALSCCADSSFAFQARATGEAGDDHFSVSGLTFQGGTFLATWIFLGEFTVDFEKSA